MLQPHTTAMHDYFPGPKLQQPDFTRERLDIEDSRGLDPGQVDEPQKRALIPGN